MTSYQEVKDFIITTDTNSNKNISSQSFTFNSASVSVGATSFVQRTYTIPLSEVTRAYQLYVNYSFQSGQYFSASRFEYVDPSATYRRYGMQLTSNPDGSLTLIIYLVNNNSSSTTFAAFDINVIRRDFLDEL